ncbi:alpha/beta fold hydrolase [Microbacterium sp. P03]|uniref:alpha/beta fold hydrolase n=1 Tax=Microbacterium sp. P03 TaxID=3366946 RepID=UPI003745264D
MKLPYAEIEFDDTGERVHPGQVKDAASVISREKATDVIVICHGWNNTAAQARDLYTRVVESMHMVQAEVPGAASRRMVVIGVLWPSIQWADDEDSGAGAGVADEQETLQDMIRARIDDASVADRLVELVPRLEASSTAQEQFVALLRKTLPASTEGEDEAAFEMLATGDVGEVLSAAKGGTDAPDALAAAGGAAGIDPMGVAPLDDGGGAGFFDSIMGAGRNLLNLTTYYTMKERAGAVGRNGVAKALEALHDAAPDARLHLVGHSFGGRAVTAAALATSAKVSSLSLLQAAYSHFGMADDWDGTGKDGAFEKVPSRIDGPIIVTFTRNDKAVGVAYPIASRLARQIGAGLGDQQDPYGGIGRNGALKTAASLPAGTLLDVGGAYAFEAGRVSSLNGDAFISGHSDITGRQVAYAVLTAVATGRS